MRTFMPIVVLLTAACLPAQARTVYRCVQGGTVSLATAPEPGSKCTARRIADDAATVPNLWGALGVVKGTLYEVHLNGELVYTTRPLSGARPLMRFQATTPEPPKPASRVASPLLDALPAVPAPRLDRFPAYFRSAARRSGVDEAWLRAIAHAESGFDPAAISPKGAQGVMQLMPETARELGVRDPFAAQESIDGGARYLRQLMRRYRGDLVLVAAAYNAGIGTVARYGGVPPYRETQLYVRRVLALHERYRKAMGTGAAGGVRVARAAR